MNSRFFVFVLFVSSSFLYILTSPPLRPLTLLRHATPLLRGPGGVRHRRLSWHWAGGERDSETTTTTTINNPFRISLTSPSIYFSLYPPTLTQLVRQLLARGNRVHATARGPSPGLAALAANPGPGRLTVRTCDVASPASVAAWSDELARDLEAAAAPGLSLVIHNAGVANWAPLKNVTADDMVDLFRVNTVGAVLTTQALLRVGAVGGKAGVPCTAAFMTSKMGSCADCGSGGSLAYRASKAALNVVVKALSIDLADRKVCATLLHPGWVVSDMTRNAPTSASESVAGMLGVLEAGAAGELDLAGAWYDYKREVVPW